MKFHIKSSRRNRNRQRSSSQNDELSASAPSSSPSIASLSTAVVAPSSSSAEDHPTDDVLPLRSCLRTSPIHHQEEKVKQSSLLQQVVRFQDVHVREFEVIVGDNPSCSSGAPISIGWKHIDSRSVPLDEFEQDKVYVKNSLELVLSRQDREAILMEWGVPWDEIIQAVRSNVKVKYQRRRTVIDYDRWEEMLETAGRTIKQKILFRHKSKVDEHLRAWEKKPPAAMTTRPQPLQCSISTSGSSQRSTNSTVKAESNHSCGDLSSRSDPLPEMEKLSLESETPRRRSASEGDSEANRKLQLQLQLQQLQQHQYERQSATSSTVKKYYHQTTIDSEETASLSTHPSEAGSHPFVIEFDRNDSGASTMHYRQLEDSRCYYIVNEANADDDNNCDTDTLSSAYSQAGYSSIGDGSFERLSRDFSFWQLHSEVTNDGPRIRRLATPVVICEQDDDDDGAFDGIGVPCRTPQSSWYGPPHPPPHHLVPNTSQPRIPQQLYSTPGTSFNVIEGRYVDDANGVDNRNDYHRRRDSPGFHNMAPPHNSTHWNWE